MSVHYLCIEDDCIERKRQLLTYMSAKREHIDHKFIILDPVNFIKLFNNSNFLFDATQLKQLQRDMIAQYNEMEIKMMNRIVQMITLQNQQAKQILLQNTLEIAKIFHLDNEIEFVEKIKKESQKSSIDKLPYLAIANLYLKTGQTNLKPTIMNTFRSQIKEHMTRTQQALKQSLGVFASLMKFNSINYVHQEKPQSHQKEDQEDHNMEEQVTLNQLPQKMPQKPKQTQVSFQIMEREDQQYLLPSPKSAPIPIIPAILPIQNTNITNSSNSHQNIEIPDSHQTQSVIILSKQMNRVEKGHKKIAKDKKQSFVQYKLPTYQNEFKQLDMDSFFPKGPIKEELKSLTQHAKSPFFKKTIFPEDIVIQSEADLVILQQNCQRIGRNINLTISQTIMDPNLVFNIFTIPNQLKSIRLKDFVIHASCKDNFKALLAQNSHSLQTLMLQECWLLPEDITEQISKLVKLKKLKLHASYQRKFKLCFEHIFNLQELQYLSLSSASFIDLEGEQIHLTSKLSQIYRFQQLKYLCLYNCYPVHSDLLGYLHPKLCHTLQHLNMGITDITSEIISQLWKFKNIKEFSVDETQLKGRDIIQILQKMQVNKIKQLSLWQLNNSSWSQDKRGYLNGFITQNEMLELTKLLPHLQYLNISHCKSLRGFNLLKFPNLKYVCISKDLYTKKEVNRFRKKMHVFIENFNEEAIIKATQSDVYYTSPYPINYEIQLSKQEEDSQFNPNQY